MAAVAPEVRILPDRRSVAMAAAELFMGTARAAIAAHGAAAICLSGGNTPTPMYEALARGADRDRVDWTKMHMFWGDERCVPPSDVNSNYRAAREQLLDHVPIRRTNIHRIRGELDPMAAAEDYTHTLLAAGSPRRWPRFDLVLLGLGGDGHTASLFPGLDIVPGRAVMTVRAPAGAGGGWRITLTPAVLNDARQVVFVVQGPSKSAIVAAVLQGEFQPETVPAQWIAPSDGQLIWLLDKDAAALISG